MNPFPMTAIEQALGGRFTIGALIRAGGQGTVYRGVRSQAPNGSIANDEVALKLYIDPDQDERVRREVAAMERIRHSALAGLIEHGNLVIAGRSLRYVVWEYIDGEALDNRVARGPLPPATVAVIGRDVALAINELWRNRIVHRDVKPKNIMLRTGEREAVLIDLGVARHLNEGTITGVGLAWGTLGYMSPEQRRAERQLTCKSDLFSLGISLLEGLAGRHPTGGDQQALLIAAPRTSQLAPACPAGLAQIIDALLQARGSFRPNPADAARAFTDLLNAL